MVPVGGPPLKVEQTGGVGVGVATEVVEPVAEALAVGVLNWGVRPTSRGGGPWWRTMTRATEPTTVSAARTMMMIEFWGRRGRRKNADISASAYSQNPENGAGVGGRLRSARRRGVQRDPAATSR